MQNEKYTYTDELDAETQIECEEQVAGMIFDLVRGFDFDSVEEFSEEDAKEFSQQIFGKVVSYLRPELLVERAEGGKETKLCGYCGSRFVSGD